MEKADDKKVSREQIAVLTGGRDKPYALGLAAALSAADWSFDFIGSDDVSSPDLLNDPHVRFLNLRDQRPGQSVARKISRVLRYYLRLMYYAATSDAVLFHILWTNKIEWFDRTMLLVYYRVLRKRLVFTAHNINAGERDGRNSWFNRLTLRAQYSLADHIFVHTEKMKRELTANFGVAETKATVIPFGINNSVPSTALTPTDARGHLGLSATDKVMLFFGNIAPYKGLEFLIEAFATVCREDSDYRLVIAGRPKGPKTYWAGIQKQLSAPGVCDRVVQRIEYIPDAETEVFFKAADILVLPYSHVFQSGVLFLGYSFGLPAIAAAVGSLNEEIIPGKTGFIFPAKDSAALAMRIREYFGSAMYRSREPTRKTIRDYANARYSWSTVAAITTMVYANLLEGTRPVRGG